MPAFEDLARDICVRSADLLQADLGDRWSKRLSTAPAARVYATLRGGAVVDVHQARVPLGPKELLLLPRGDAHVIRDQPATPVERGEEFCRALRWIDDGVLRAPGQPETRLLVVDLHLEDLRAPWLAILPASLRLAGDMPGVERWLGETLGMLASAPSLGRGVRSAILSAWTQTLFAHALRTAAPAIARAGGYDEAVVAALAAVRSRLGHPWELAEVARRVGLSRAAFSARATAALGEPFGVHLRRLRLRRAAELLVSSTLPVKAIALRVGYESESAFARAFARELGTSPRAYRRAAARAGGAATIQRA